MHHNVQTKSLGTGSISNIQLLHTPSAACHRQRLLVDVAVHVEPKRVLLHWNDNVSPEREQLRQRSSRARWQRRASYLHISNTKGPENTRELTGHFVAPEACK